MPRFLIFFLPSGLWNQELLQKYFPPGIIEEIVSSGVQMHDDRDSVHWSPSADGLFSIKSAVASFRDPIVATHAPLFKRIWSWVGPQRIRAFLWLLGSNALLSNSNRVRRHIAQSGICSICLRTDESNLHAVRDCGWARSVWLRFLPRRNLREFFNLSLHDWISSNLSGNQYPSSSNWNLTFPFVAAGIWYARNAYLFDDSPLDIATISSSIHRQIEEASSAFSLVNNQTLRPDVISSPWVRWTPPDPDWIKLNSDGSLLPSLNCAGYGGLFRNHHGQFLHGFAIRINASSVLEAELMGILIGL
ncbi:Ribonuclease H-like superfamily [Sesbania bispinosa]|nr:Ribonuclease H-like superfamily [Sesbania bispinosa]